MLPARMEHLRTYKWSSYRSYIGLAQRLEWVDYEPMLALMGGRDKERMERYRCFVEVGIAADDEEFIAAMSRSTRSIGGDDFREWVDERHVELLKERRHPEDVTLRREMGRRPEPGMILAAVASAAGTTVEGLKARRRDGIWKGIAARLMVIQAGMTRRECAHWLGVRAGSAVGYQIKRAEVALKADARLARRVARLESQWKAGH